MADWNTQEDVTPGDAWQAVGLRAYRRYAAARQRWADEHGLKPPEMGRLGRGEDAPEG